MRALCDKDFHIGRSSAVRLVPQSHCPPNRRSRKNEQGFEKIAGKLTSFWAYSTHLCWQGWSKRQKNYVGVVDKRAGLTPSKFFWPAQTWAQISNYLKKRPRGLALGHREMGVFLTHPPRCRAPPACWKWPSPAHSSDFTLYSIVCSGWSTTANSHLLTHVVDISTINMGANAITICFLRCSCVEQYA